MKIDTIINAIKLGLVRVTGHSQKEAENDHLTLDEIYHSVENGVIIEDYPDDYPFPSCLICGFNSQQQPIHTVWAYNENKQLAILITVYRPDPNQWVNNYQRRKL